MESSKMIATPRTSSPAARALGELPGLPSRRRELLKMGLVVAVSVTIATLVVVAASFVGTHLVARWWLENHQGIVVWDIDDTNWRHGGVTTASFPTGRFMLSNLGDGDLDHLHRLHRLVSLNLVDNHEITDKGLAGLRGLDFLTELSLDRMGRLRAPSAGSGFPALTDACLVHLQSLPRLETLSLAGNKITDQGLAQIAAMTRLKSLDLCATEVTDAGLSHLEQMKGLKSVDLAATRVTPQGLARLKAARPDLTIEFDTDEVLEETVKRLRGDGR